MAYRKQTLRSMSPVTRKVARLIGEQQSVAKRLKNLIPDIQRLEMESKALVTATQPVTDARNELLTILAYFLTFELTPSDQKFIDFIKARLEALETPKKYICLWCKKTTIKPIDGQCPYCKAVNSLVDYKPES